MAEVTENLEELLDQAGPVILANGWVTQEQWIEIDLSVRTGNRPTPTVGRSVITSALLERKVLTRDQGLDLDAILISQRLFTDFRLERKLGSGGMGTVFLARHVPTNRAVALKTMNARLAADQGFVERFHREARALERLDHPNVAQIIASGEEGGECWLAMEYIQGPSLMSLLKQHKILPEAWCLQVTRQIAAGLGYVWTTAGLVHRDLKPENILVTGEDLAQPPVAKLIDFGLVKNNQEDDRLTQTGMTIGTPLYMSPEQVRGEKLDVRSDIYGLGATLFHLLTGGTPYNGSSPGTIMSAHLTEAVPDPGARVPSLSQGTRTLVMTAMAKSVDQRFLSCEALIQACDQALEALEPQRGDAPKLLRKPLILKPIRRERTPLANEVLPPLPMPAPQDARRASSADSARRPVATADRRSSSVSERRPVATADHRSPNASERRLGAVAQTDSQRLKAQEALTELLPDAEHGQTSGPLQPTPAVAKPPSSRQLKSPLPLAPPAVDKSRPRSAAFTETHHSAGIGLLPWVVLSAAVLALLGYLVLA
jgi:serine/threonine protein kinase